jgi:hypothetical protein
MLAPLFLAFAFVSADPLPSEPTPVQPTPTATSAAPRIDLVSMGVGGELYAVFGHAAIRVIHPDGRDVAYNFGGVNINVPNFWVTLMRGRVQAYLEVTSYTDLLLKYSGEDRTIVGRTLNFTPEQAKNIVRELDAIAADPVRRNYDYNHMADNCTTRIAVLFDEQLGGALSRQSHVPVRGTYRDWIIETIRNQPFLYLLMDLTGNGFGDVPIDRWQTTFLPVGLDAAFDAAKIDGRPFVIAKYTDYRTIGFGNEGEWDWPWTKVYLFFVVPLFALGFWKPRITAFFFGLAAGAMGLFYLVLFLGSDYVFLNRNWNVLNFPPTHLALAAFAVIPGWWSRFEKQRRIYLFVCLALLTMLALAKVTGIVVQAVWPMLFVSVPLTLVLGVRSK